MTYPGYHLYGMDILSMIDDIHENKNEPVATDFSLSGYPNPFNPSTRITITLPGHDNGVLSIYDIQGRFIKEYTIHNNGGTNYSVIWNAENNHNERVASGFYLAVLRILGPSGDNSQNQNRRITKLVYLKWSKEMS